MKELPINDHSAGLLYERLIMRAFNCREGENGAKAGYFQNLYRAERKESHGLMAGSFQDQFEDIQNNLVKAIQKLGVHQDLSELLDIEGRIKSCSTTNCLAKEVKYIIILLAAREQ